MKKISILSLFLLLSSLSLFSQSETMAGKYVCNHDMKNDDALDYEMTLNTDGTFSFYYHLFTKFGVPQEKNFYGKGMWIAENNVVTFSTDAKKDIDDKHTLNFTNTKARFVTKSPRDTTDKIVATKLQFLKSDIPWMARIDLSKM